MHTLLKRQEGFTLIELMVVVLIIGILVAIAIPIFNSTRANAQRKACWASERTMEGNIQQYNAEVLPVGGPVITALTQLTTPITTGGQAYGAWLVRVPTCPSNGTYSIANGMTVNCSVHNHF